MGAASCCRSCNHSFVAVVMCFEHQLDARAVQVMLIYWQLGAAAAGGVQCLMSATDFEFSQSQSRASTGSTSDSDPQSSLSVTPTFPCQQPIW